MCRLRRLTGLVFLFSQRLNDEGVEEIRSRIHLTHSAFSHMREISLLTMGRAYQAVVRSILLYSCETWLVRKADERMLKVFGNDSIRTILHAEIAY